MELSMASAGKPNPEDFSCQTEEPTGQLRPEADFNVCGRPSRQQKPPNWYRPWVAG